MPEYVVTGKKGSGKGLLSVDKIRDYLYKRNRVATNHDLKLRYLIGPYAKECNVIRLPDKPKLHDLLCIGIGNPTIKFEMISIKDAYGHHAYWHYEIAEDQPDFQEEKNGLIVLDELGSWMNTRTFTDKERGPVLDWLIHARKYGWDIIYEVQDISMIDKQIREGFAEHVVYCKRTDRLPIPVIGAILPLKLPRMHLGVVLYGTSANAPKVDTWVCRVKDICKGYNTLQKFSNFYPHATYCYLPPFHQYGRNRMPHTWSAKMRLTKIVARKYSRILCFIVGFGLCLILSSFFSSDSQSNAVASDSKHPENPQETESELLALTDYVITGSTLLPGRKPVFQLASRTTDDVIDTDVLLSRGYKVSFKSKNNIVVSKAGGDVEIFRN